MIRLGLAYLALAIIVVVGITGIPGGSLIWGDADQTEQARLPVPDAPLLRPADVAAEGEVALADRPAVGEAATGQDEVSLMTAAILAQLTNSAPPPPPAHDPLADMSQAALSGLRGLTQATQSGRSSEPAADDLAGLVAQALRNGENDAFIDALVNEAVGRGEVAVPAAMVTTEGRVDTAVLLSTLVAKSQGDDLAEEVGEGDAPLPDVATTSTDPVARFLATEDLLYTVQVGDSLGSLALRFYGDAGRYRDIYQANKDRLGAVDKIRVGQRLVIPSLSRL